MVVFMVFGVFTTLHRSLLVVYQEVPGVQPFSLLNFFASEMCVSVGKRTEVMESAEHQESIYGKHHVAYRTDVGKNAENEKELRILNYEITCI